MPLDIRVRYAVLSEHLAYVTKLSSETEPNEGLGPLVFGHDLVVYHRIYRLTREVESRRYEVVATLIDRLVELSRYLWREADI